ncbi:MAG: ABC transporter substrate-binding protein, partial [Dehalococcoidia bacterium]|nr:ABC transporter substrate-binding protein [Dehalococcoidia bacterium]
MRHSWQTSWRLAGAALAVATVAACAPTGGPTASQAPGSEWADRQRLVIGYVSIAPSMDPQLSTSGSVRKYEMFESLVIQDDSGLNIEPLLATRWEARDAQTWRFTLRTDARFHDGVPLTAADAQFSWERATRTGFRSPIPGLLPTVAQVTAIDPQTVEVQTRQPDPLILKRLAQFVIVPRHYIEQVGDTQFALRPIGSGPFRFQDSRPEDFITVTGWMDHAYRRPFLTELTVRAIPDPSARMNGLRLGELDVVYQLSVDAVEPLRREGFAVGVKSGGIYGGFLDTIGGFGVDPGPIADRRVRQALNYAVDRETIARTIYRGLSQPSGFPIPTTLFGFDPTLRPYTFDLARARQLLAEAGYPNGFRVAMEVSGQQSDQLQVAQYLQSQWRELGITIDLSVNNAQNLDKIYKRAAIAPIYLGGRSGAPLMDADSALMWHWSRSQFGRRY